jgi:hypothetical protein
LFGSPITARDPPLVTASKSSGVQIFNLQHNAEFDIRSLRVCLGFLLSRSNVSLSCSIAEFFHRNV